MSMPFLVYIMTNFSLHEASPPQKKHLVYPDPNKHGRPQSANMDCGPFKIGPCRQARSKIVLAVKMRDDDFSSEHPKFIYGFIRMECKSLDA